MQKTFLFCLLIALFVSCSSDSDTSALGNKRPMDTWVFRSVLDQKPRMLVAALHKDLYVAYDTQKGKLYKAWNGIVNFQGAVYDGAHGPQPTSVGDAYIIDDSMDGVWFIKKGDQLAPAEYNYRGHRMTKQSFELMYELSTANGDIALITEEVNFLITENGQLKLIRNFSAKNNTDIVWKSNAILVDKSQIESNANFVVGEGSPMNFKSKQFFNYPIQLHLNENGNSQLEIPLLETVFLDPNIDDGFESDESSLPLGAQLIGRNDCKICHNVSKQTVGPSYKAIAKKYEHSDENMVMLTDKIKAGGSGIWGQQVMTPHPEVPENDLREMVKYIFLLDEFEGESSTPKGDLSLINAIEIDESKLMPGILTRIYSIPNNTQLMPINLMDQKPIQAGILQNYNNISGGDFKELEDNFALVGIGMLNIEETTIYNFRLWSDDGSKLFLHNKAVIDNDGNHSTEMKQVSVMLEKGLHPFRIEFFQGNGGKFLSFNMKSEKDKSWKVVPPEMLSHDKGDRKYVSSLSLPMSVITKIPGDRMPVLDVHPAFDITQARPDDFSKKIGGLDFLSDGSMLVSVWEKDGSVYKLENHANGNPDEISYKKIAEGLAEPLGLKVVDDRIFIMQKQELTELIDLDGDHIIDEYRTVCDDWGVTANFHEFGFGLEEKHGYLYANLATGILPGGAGMPNQHQDRGSCIKVSIEDGSMEILANGLRTPNGIGLGFNDELFIADNQGDWLPSSKIIHVTKGDWFGSRVVDFDGTKEFKEKKPVVWLPQDEIGNSPSTPLWLNVGPYKNQMIHGEVTHGGIKRVFVEEVNGAFQGAVFRFIQGLEAGVNRIRWAPDGSLYAGGIGNPGNWQQSGKLWYGLQRLNYNGNSAFEMLAVRAKSDGIEIEFTEVLKPGDGVIKDDYEIRQWYYLPTENYGGPKLDDKPLDILSVNVSEDRKRVFIELDDMEEDHVVYIRLKNHFISEEEHSLWSTEAWYTMNYIPQNDFGFKSKQVSFVKSNGLTELESEDGWILLFDGNKIDQFHTYNGQGVDSKWKIDNGALHFNPEAEGNGGDLVTNDEFENFELCLEWKISNCGNSGIFFNSVEDKKYCCPYLTGPEMQVLDNTCHPDSRFETHRAGDLYDMIETSIVTVNPAGEWNKVRIISNQGDVQFWLNGYKVVEFGMYDENWNAMIADSKFKDWEDFGKFKSGHIGLQDHGDKVWYRNIKIKRL